MLTQALQDEFKNELSELALSFQNKFFPLNDKISRLDFIIEIYDKLYTKPLERFINAHNLSTPEIADEFKRLDREPKTSWSDNLNGLVDSIENTLTDDPTYVMLMNLYSVAHWFSRRVYNSFDDLSIGSSLLTDFIALSNDQFREKYF